jgi:Xaa-Pro dipeptidase
MGLECHDVGDGGALLLTGQNKRRNWISLYSKIIDDPSAYAASILAPNMVITVEPGM